jgi:hypothetical protein
LQTGFARARGALLGWVNSDDTLLPGAISAVVTEFERDPELLIVYGDNLLLDERSNELGPLPAREFDVLEMLRTMQNHVPQPGSLFSRHALEIAPLNEAGYYYFDFEFAVQLGLHGRGLRLHRPLGGYRLHDEAKSLSAPRRKAEDQLRMADVVFGLPDLPPNVRGIEAESRATAERTAAEYLYAAGDHARARRLLLSAARRNPASLRVVAPIVVRTLLPPRAAAALRRRRTGRATPGPSSPS